MRTFVPLLTVSLNLDGWNRPEHLTRSAVRARHRGEKWELREIAGEETARALWEMKGQRDDNKYRGIVESKGKGH